MVSYHNFFPAPAYRPHQQAILEEIDQKWDDVDVFALCAPTGFGKSIVNYTVGAGAGQAYYTTPLTTLVDQIAGDDILGPRVARVYGRRNYRCLSKCAECKICDSCERQNWRYRDWKCGCHVGLCKLRKDFRCGQSCLYEGARNAALAHPMALMTTDYLLYSRLHPETKWKQRKLLIVDECQNLERSLRGFAEVGFTDAEAPVLSMPSGYEFLEQRRKITEMALAELNAKAELTEEEALTKEALERQLGKIALVLRDRDSDYDWVPASEFRPQKECYAVTFTPLTVERFSRYVTSAGSKILLSSATLTKPEFFLGLMGLKELRWHYIDVPSEWDVRRRPVVAAYAGCLNRDNGIYMMPKFVSKLEEIIRLHAGERGLVHCQSYANQHYIAAHADPDVKQRLWLHESGHRREQLTDWIQKSPGDSVFLGVAMTEGLDLRGELARFQVLFKCPFPDLGVSWVKERMAMSDGKDWYAHHTLQTIYQAYGRAIRSEDDWAIFYILDAMAGRWLWQHGDKRPAFFWDAFARGTAFGGIRLWIPT